jgi:hypothetical protein
MLQSISLRFDPIQDRLMMRLVVRAGAADTTHWLQLTRRVCAAWRLDLQQLVDRSAQAPAQLDVPSKAAVSAAHHAAMASGATLRSVPSIEPGPTEPPGLVTGIACGQNRGDGRWVIRFDVLANASLTLALSSQTLHALVDMLARHVQEAAWGLPPQAIETTRVTSLQSIAMH